MRENNTTETTLFHYKQFEVLSYKTEIDSIILSIRMSPKINQVWTSIFQCEFSDQLSAEEAVTRYIEMAKALADTCAQGWTLCSKERFNNKSFVFKFGRKEKLIGRKLTYKPLTKNALKKYLKRLPDRKETLHLQQKEENISLEKLIEVSKISREEIIIEQAVSLLSQLKTDEILKVIDQLNLTPTTTDVSTLIRTHQEN